MKWKLTIFLGAACAIPTAALADPCEGPLPSSGAVFSGIVRYVGDGDSICVGASGNASTWIEVRVADFYAPELHSTGGPQAKAAMERIAMGRNAQCVAGRRSYDRVVAQCTLNGTSIGDLMRREGVAEGGRGR
jgi:micrococcal nuclease